MGAVLSFFRPAPVARGDWSQQEIAEFYRVEAALTQAGLHVTTDRGVSDEGDPWFVFCRFDGDVILHFARIDDLYVVASEAFGRPLQGPDFRALLNAVAAEHPTLVPLPRPDARGARGNLVLHPAALLAAIVATAAFQLAGGDAMAGELAGEGAASPMLQPGADLPGGDPTGPESALHDPHGSAGAHAGAGEDENRSARHAVILSALALISATLPSDQADDPGLTALGEGAATGSQGKASVKHAPDADPAREGMLASKRAEASASAPIVEAAGEPASLARTSFVTIGPAPTPTNVEGLNLAALNILGLGAAGGQEMAAVRVAESAPPIAAILAMRGAGHAPSVAAAVEKATAPAVTESAPVPSAGVSSHGASPSAPAVSLPNAGVPTAVSSVPGAEPSGGGSLTSTAGAGPLPTPAAASAPGASIKAAGASGTLDMTHAAAAVSAAATSTASTSATTSTVQTVSVVAVTYTANGVTRSALSSFIDQYVGTGTGGVPTAAGATNGGDATDSWLTGWAKGIGSRTSADVLGSPLKHTSGASAEAARSSAALTDHAADTAMAAAQISGTLGSMAGSEVKVGFAGAPSTTDASLGGTLAASGAVGSATATDTVSAPATSVTAVTDKLLAAGTIASANGHTAALAAPAPATTADKLPAAVAPAAADVHSSATAPTDTAALTAPAPATTADKLPAAVAPAAADGHADAAAPTDTAALAAPAPATTADKHPAAVAPVTADGHISATAADALTTATSKLVGAGDAPATLDTTALKLPTSVASAPALDDRGRELIERTLDTTAQDRTVVSEHSSVIIDTETSHVTNPDFAPRTWNIGHDVEISIVGVASDAHLTHAVGIAG